MTEPSRLRQLRPSLLDRLTDRHPHRQLEAAHERVVSEQELHELVRRDLTWLFNTTRWSGDADLARHPHVTKSVLNYGLPALTGRLLSSVKTEELAEHVLAALLRYEPRLVPDSIELAVKVGESAAGTGALIIEIKAELWAEPLPLDLFVRTEVDVETGRVSIEDARAEQEG